MVAFLVMRRLALLVIAICSAMFVPCVQADSVTLETLKTAGVSGWNEVERLHRQTTFVVNEVNVNEIAGRPRLQWTENLSCHHDGKRFMIEDGENRIRGGNGRYLFSLDRMGADARWSVSSLSFVDAEERAASGYEGTHAAWCLYGVPLQRVIADPSFEMMAAEEVSDASGRQITVEFKIDSSQQFASIERLAGGRFTCNPARNWAIESYRLALKPRQDLPDGVHISGAVTYGPPAADFLNLKQLSSKLSWVDGDGRNSQATFEITVESSSRCELPDEKFTLSGFGLPEPGRPPAGRFAGPWLWFVVAGVAAIAVAVFLWRRG